MKPQKRSFFSRLCICHDRLVREGNAPMRGAATPEQRMLALAFDALWEYEAKGETFLCNEAYIAAFGRPEKNVCEWWRMRTHPDDYDRVVESMRKAVNEGNDVWEATYRLCRIDGEWVEVQTRASFLRDAHGELARIVGATRDLSATVARREGERTVVQRLHQSQKLESIGSLACGIAHDVNNVLGIIMTNGETGLAGMSDPDPDLSIVGECLDEILVAAQRARDLVRQILAFGSPNTVQNAPLQPCDVVDECMRMLRSTLPKTVTLDWVLPPRCQNVLSNAPQLQQILVNLCTNAWQALPATGGRIAVTVDDLFVSRPLVAWPSVVPRGSYVRIAVEDNGHGIPHGVRDRIFDAYFTTKGEGKGTGLGLSMVRGIVSAHDGFVTVTSVVNHGTRFEVYLPAIAAGSTADVRNTASRGRGERIALLDDDAAMARATQRVLVRNGYVLDVFHRADHALSEIGKGVREYDLVITDYTMPGMSGTEFARCLQEIRPELPVVLLSGLSEHRLRERICSANVKKVLEKPVPPEALYRIVGDLMARQVDQHRAGITLLVIDDDPAFLDACCMLLQQEGFRVLRAGTGRQGLQVVAESDVSVVLTDILMPEVDGVEVIMDLRSRYPSIKVVAMSGGGQLALDECLEIPKALGVSGILRKPFTRRELVSAIEIAIGHP